MGIRAVGGNLFVAILSIYRASIFILYSTFFNCSVVFSFFITIFAYITEFI